ncbi:hypothetical protein BDZ94DRAFT_1251290 [Collybia nuda]|uniref:Uncharacterized protein n=1 Tax=Collybia nuda TaxID=64659 RepID=A0A9P6CLS2_9AGAR|nr:hypothetical protein BDZ94DRAFT_1251290 [Collybia nuda]
MEKEHDVIISLNSDLMINLILLSCFVVHGRTDGKSAQSSKDDENTDACLRLSVPWPEG